MRHLHIVSQDMKKIIWRVVHLVKYVVCHLVQQKNAPVGVHLGAGKAVAVSTSVVCQQIKEYRS